jgi:hypothetical protein
MSNQNYSLEIISHHPKFNNKSLRKYYVDGVETIGVWGDEPFEIRFKNNTWNKVQVKLTLDGTDILTGKPADTNVSKDMWVVNGYGTLSLKAWPETNNGGAAFVFTGAGNSVAVHTHGDLSSRGIIAAAVFTEGHVEPAVEHHHHYSWPYYTPVWIKSNDDYKGYDSIRSRGIIGGTSAGTNTSIYTSNTGGTFSSSTISCNNAASAAGSFSLNEIDEANSAFDSLVSVGAGAHVDQKIAYVTGLVKPIFSEAVRVKYLWWDDLTAKLRTETHAQPQPTGFPGDNDKKNIDLKCTPRIGENKGVFRRVEQQAPYEYSRF